MKKQTLVTAALWLAATFAPAAIAQTVHVAGSGASSQFLTAGLGADTLALSLSNVGVPTYSTNAANCNTNGDSLAVYHYTGKNGAYLVDSRSTNIPATAGNVWVVWTAACSDATGSTGVQDIWINVSVDGTTAIRGLYAQQPNGTAGAQIGIVTPPPSVANLIAPSALWPDNAVDVALPANVYNVIGTGITSATVGSDVHVNLALSEERAEDALVITTRSLTNGNASLSGLGYRLIQGNANFGSSILSGQPGSTNSATPENFALSGGADPVTGITVPAVTEVPIGAAPVIFAYNNNGAGAGNYPTNLISGVKGTGVAGGPYLLANLFDGTTTCDTTNPAFGFSGPTANVNLVLREPLGSAAAVVEYSLFRTTGNTSDSQEKGVSGAGTLSQHPVNPLSAQTCAGGGGSRSRAIGSSEVVTAIDTQANALGYFFYSFPNAAKFKGGANFTYLTIDGVDPLGGIGGPNQTLPYCPTGSATNCPASLWPGNQSYSTLRNGTYPAWSVYRWFYYSSNTDPVGPSALATATENAVDTTVADYVPFYTATGGIGGVSDGLTVYHSHYKDTVPTGACGSGCKTVTGVNGTATSVNASNGGNTLGIGDAGGDVGGVIEGPFGIATAFTGTVTTSGTLTKNKGYKVAWKTGEKFVASASWEGGTINIDGVNYTIANVLPTTSTLYVTSTPGVQTGVAYSATLPTALASGAGVLNKKR
jgi:hypothetical protein